MKPGISRLLFAALLGSSASVVFAHFDGLSTEPSVASAKASSSSGLLRFPHGRFEYVEARTTLRLPGSRSVDLAATEKVTRKPTGLWVTGGISEQSNRGSDRSAALALEGSYPRVMDLHSSTASAAHRAFRFGNDHGNTFSEFGDQAPTLGVAPQVLMERLSRDWGTVRTRKLDHPFHYSLELERATPAGVLTATVVYRNVGSAARSIEIDQAVAVAAATDLL